MKGDCRVANASRLRPTNVNARQNLCRLTLQLSYKSLIHTSKSRWQEYLRKVTLVDVLRWAFVTPGALFGWVIAFMAGYGTEKFLYSLCPIGKIISDSCTASWYLWLSPNLFPVYTALAAALVISLPMLAAPSHKLRVGWIFYGLGSVAAIGLALSFSPDISIIASLASALLTGFVTLNVWQYVLRRRQSHPEAVKAS